MIERNWNELIRPEKPQIEAGADAERRARMVAEPLERGFGGQAGRWVRRRLEDRGITVRGGVDVTAFAQCPDQLGDVHPGVEHIAGRLSGATGGVGPMTRAMLLTNVVECAEAAQAEGMKDSR